MKTKRIITLILLSISITLLSHAQIKIGIIDYEELLKAVPEHASYTKELRSLVDEHGENYNLLMKEYEEKMADYNKNKNQWTDAMRELKESEISKLASHIEWFQSEAEGEVDKKKDEMFKKLMEQVNNAIIIVGKENGYTYIFDKSSPIYTGDKAATVTTDLTAKVKAKLNN